MNRSTQLFSVLVLALAPMVALAESPTPQIARFSVEYMDRSVDPSVDFYNFAVGNWMKTTTIPADKSGWTVFHILHEQNQALVHEILDSAAADRMAPAKSTVRMVGDLYRSAMDTNRIEQLGIMPVKPDLARIDALKSKAEIARLLGEFGMRGTGAGLFSAGVEPDEKNTSVYTFSFSQGGLGMPDRDYYLSSKFIKERAAYSAHITKMLKLAGENEREAKKHAKTIIKLETAIAKASKSSTDLRDPNANYHKVATKDLVERHTSLALGDFLSALGIGSLKEVVVRQPEFFVALDKMVKARPLDEWKAYLRWHVLSSAAPLLSSAFENESFAFNGTVLSGQPNQEPRWQRSAEMVDGALGEALGQIYVEKHFPPAARARMQELIADVKAVFRNRLETVAWMSPATRAKALTKFERFTQKIGSPDKFRDYSSVEIRPDDYYGNARRASEFGVRRELARVGGPVDRTEWGMTPPTVNAYFNPSLNEIVFPAGILQPPFFDATADDAVNYGAIGFVIGHEVTHGYDDQGRQYDADGNLNDWWTEADAKEFGARAKKLSDQYSSYEPLPGVKVNGQLTMGENIADLGGVSIAYEALQRALAKDPSKRKNIDGFTPEQRFFLAAAQVWRTKQRDEAIRRQVTTNPHSPGQYRATGPLVNMQEFFDAFGIKEGSPMWRPVADRTKIW